MKRLAVKEIGVAQTEVLNALEASAKELKTTLGELPNQGESMVRVMTDQPRVH